MAYHITQLARQLRIRQTPTESRMWALLRDRRFMGYKFYRQYPFGLYIVDFCCKKKKLIIELDGGGHNFEIQKQKDIERDRYLISLGYKIIRIWNNEFINNEDGVMERLADLLKE